MARYFFHTADGHRVRDVIGTELPSHRAARVEAIQLAGRLLADQPDFLWDGNNFRVEVTDRDGALLFTIIALAVDGTASSAAENADRTR